MEKVTLNVLGMSCSHCENAIKSAVSALDGIENVSISLKDKTVVVEYDKSIVSLDTIKNEIRDQGYDINS